MAVSEEQPPFETEAMLREYLSRQFRAAKLEDDNKDQVSRYTAIPTKVSIGKAYYFTQAVGGDPDITQEGLYVYKSTGWAFIA